MAYDFPAAGEADGYLFGKHECATGAGVPEMVGVMKSSGRFPANESQGLQFSHRKRMIRWTGRVAVACTLVSLWVAVALVTGRLHSTEVPLFLLLPTTLWCTAVAAGLVAEFARVRHFGTVLTSDEADTRPGDYQLMVWWCPAALRWTPLPGMAVFVLALAIEVGNLAGFLGGDEERVDAIAELLGICAGLLVVVPILWSASRMSGAYVEHVHPRLRKLRSD